MNKCYIIVVWDNGSPYFYQTNNKIAWCFEHGVKAYVRLENAKRVSRKLFAKYRNDKVCIYHINRSASFSACDFIQGKFEKDLVFLRKK